MLRSSTRDEAPLALRGRRPARSTSSRGGAQRGGRGRSTSRRKEFVLLEYLMRNADRVLSKTMILEHVWGYSLRSADQRRRRAGEPSAIARSTEISLGGSSTRSEASAMSSAPSRPEGAPAGTRAWRSLGARLALWYAVVTLGSSLALAAIVAARMHAWAEGEGRRAAETVLERYRAALESRGNRRGAGDVRTAAVHPVEHRRCDWSATSTTSSGFRGSTRTGLPSRVADALRERTPRPRAEAHPQETWRVVAATVSRNRRARRSPSMTTRCVARMAARTRGRRGSSSLAASPRPSWGRS